MTAISVYSSSASEGPYGGTWESPFIGYIATNSGNPLGVIGSLSTNTIFGQTIYFVGLCTFEGNPIFMLGLANDASETFFSTATVTLTGGTGHSYNATLTSAFYPTGNNTVFGLTVPTLPGPVWIWNDPNADFSSGIITTIAWSEPVPPTPTAPSGKGDITDPEAWQDAAGNIPPLQFSNVPYNVNYPLNGDGRYWFEGNANTLVTNTPITFIGNPNYLINTATLQWSVTGTANDGGGLLIAYSTTTGTWTTVTMLPQTQLNGIQNGAVDVPLFVTGQLQVQVYTQGGTPLSTATFSQVAVAITRNANETLTWDAPNPFDPTGYNGLVADSVVPTDTLGDLQFRMLVRLGFANQASNPPPGMATLVQDFLINAQKYLYRRYLQLHTKRLFRWKVNPGQRFYSLRDNDENATEGVNMDYAKTIEWAGIQDSRNVWYPLIQGIPPQLYTMITKPWRPARYELKGSIELYPTPDQTYWLWMKGHFGLMPFINTASLFTIDSELVFMHALANAKAHYGQPDANNIEAQANAYRMELIAATHQTAHYLPGTIAVPPAVRPTLIQFDPAGSGG